MSVHNTIIPAVAKSVFPSPKVRTMPYKSNLKELASYRASAPKENRAVIELWIELYSSKKIPNFKTVENAVTRLASHTKSKPTQTKAVREYDKIAGKYKDALPITGRIQRQIVEKRKKALSKTLSITLILFRLANAGDAEATVNVPGVGGEGRREKGREETPGKCSKGLGEIKAKIWKARAILHRKL
jgi:hypothetical protein